MTLIAAGQNTRNRAMLGLQAMSREEAEREALYQQMRQAEKAQRAQLAGTGLGIAGQYAVTNPDKVAALGSKIFGGGQAAGLNIGAPSTAGIQQALAATKAGSSIGSAAGTAASGTLEAGVANALSAPVGQSAFLQTGAGLSATAPAAQAASGAAATGKGLAATQAAVAQATGAAATGTAATGAATGAATAGTGAAAGAAGSLAPLAAMAGPLAIGLGAFFLLNKLFD